MTPATTPAVSASVVDRTPTSSFDAVLRLGLDKATEYAHPVVMAKLQKLGLDEVTANQKASNLIDSAGDLAFDLVDVITDIKVAAKTK